MAQVVGFASVYTNHSMPGMIKVCYEYKIGELETSNHSLPTPYMFEYSKECSLDKFDTLKRILISNSDALNNDHYYIALNKIQELFGLIDGPFYDKKNRPVTTESSTVPPTPRKRKEDMKNVLKDGQEILCKHEKKEFIGKYDSNNNKILYNGMSYDSPSGFALSCVRTINTNITTMNGWVKCKKRENGQWVSLK
jgi:hypothetical protein